MLYWMTNPDKEAVCCLVQIKDLFQLVGNLTSVGFYLDRFFDQ